MLAEVPLERWMVYISVMREATAETPSTCSSLCRGHDENHMPRAAQYNLVLAKTHHLSLGPQHAVRSASLGLDMRHSGASLKNGRETCVTTPNLPVAESSCDVSRSHSFSDHGSRIPMPGFQSHGSQGIGCPLWRSALEDADAVLSVISALLADRRRS